MRYLQIRNRSALELKHRSQRANQALGRCRAGEGMAWRLNLTGRSSKLINQMPSGFGGQLTVRPRQMRASVGKRLHLYMRRLGETSINDFPRICGSQPQPAQREGVDSVFRCGKTPQIVNLQQRKRPSTS